MFEKPTGLIVLEGHDGSGKSYLASKICERFNAVYLHQKYKFKNKIFTYHTARLWKAIKLSQERLVVLDRLWLSETIYSAIYRQNGSWPLEGRMMDRVLLKHCAMNVICFDDPHVAKQRHEKLVGERDELFKDRMDEVAQYYADYHYGSTYSSPRPGVNYADAICNAGGACKRIDHAYYSRDLQGKTPEKLDEFVHAVARQIDKIKLDQYVPALNPYDHNFLGHLGLATHLIVGDIANPKSKKLSWPFYDYGHSSLFLTEALHRINFDETTALWTNAHGHPKHVEAIVALRPSIKVVALGHKASGTLARLGVNHQAVAHPQWVKRFLSHDRQSYATELKQALTA